MGGCWIAAARGCLLALPIPAVATSFNMHARLKLSACLPAGRPQQQRGLEAVQPAALQPSHGECVEHNHDAGRHTDHFCQVGSLPAGMGAT
jgi:hypothetical protein